MGSAGTSVVQRRLGAIGGIGNGAARGILEIVGRQETEQLANHGQALGVVLRGEVGHAAGSVVGHGSAQLLLGDFLVRDGLDDVGPGDKHVGRRGGHENEIGDGRGINGAAGARAQDGADLRDHAAGQGVAQEDIGVAGQGHDALLNARTAGIVEADERRADAHGGVHDFADLGGVGFGERAAEDGEVLREDINQAAVNAAVAGNEAVAGRGLLLHAEVHAAMGDELIDLLEGAFVEEQGDALTRGQLAGMALAFAALGASAFFGGGAAAAQLG
jgi:hypothetical protein